MVPDGSSLIQNVAASYDRAHGPRCRAASSNHGSRWPYGMPLASLMTCMETIETPIKKVWFITGTSTGFGRRTAVHALEAGHYVVATSRNMDDIDDLNETYSDRVLTLELDVTKPKSIEKAIQAAIERHRRIDIVMNNAGLGLGGAIEETTDEEARSLYDVNVFGMLNVIRAALPHFRERNEGMFINLSSLVGLSAIPGIGIYSSTKFAVEGISEALAQEVSNLGISVVMVEPGAFDTEFASNMRMVEDQIDDYKEVHQSMKEGFDFRGDPEKAAEAIVAAATSEHPPTRLLLGPDCVDAANAKVAQLRQEIDRWEQVSRATDKGLTKPMKEAVDHV